MDSIVPRGIATLGSCEDMSMYVLQSMEAYFEKQLKQTLMLVNGIS